MKQQFGNCGEMDFSLSDEQQMAVDSFRRFLDAEIRPIAEQYKDKYIPRERALEIQKSLAPFGVVNGILPESVGGMGLPGLTVGLLMHELARVSPDIAITSLIYIAAGKLLPVTPPHLLKKYRAPFINCDICGAVAMSEPDIGSDPSSIKLKAKLDGDHYVLNGEKLWISSGGYSDFLYVLARASGGEKEGLALFLVDREHGYQTSNIEKTALNSQSTAQVSFSDVRVPIGNIVVEPGGALKVLFTLLGGSRPLVGLMALGVAQAALDEAVKYAQDRTQFGSPIGAKQMIQDKIATMATQLEAGKLLCYRALHALDKGEKTQITSAMAKWYGTEIACEIVNAAVQIHGGNGITREYPVEYLQRAVRVFPFTEGTTEIQKLMIGREILGLSAF